MNVTERAEENLQAFGDYEAVITGHRVWRNRELLEQSSRLASALAASSVRPGDRVLVTLPGSGEGLVAALAIWRCGAVLVCVHPSSPVNEVTRIARHCHAVAIITAPDTPAAECARDVAKLWISIAANRAELEPQAVGFDELIGSHGPMTKACLRSASDLAQLTYTSGTTGSPKAVIYTHGSIDARSRLDGSLDNLYVKHVEPSAATAQDVLLTCLPPTAFAGLMFHVRLRSNTKLIVLGRFDPALVLGAIQRHRVTRFAMVPSMGEALLASPELGKYDCASLRELMVSGAHASPALLERLEKWIGVRPFITYGLTEAGGPVAVTDPSSPLDSVGRIIPGTAAKICDESGQQLPDGEVGEIYLKTPWMAAGYLDDPVETAAVFVDGWVRTGDRGSLRGGHLILEGRIKELIIQAGVNIVPHEVADVILGIPGVVECAVVGVPQPFLGEEAVACVVRSAGRAITAEDILGRCRAEIDARKVPVRICFVDKLPRTASGKVQIHVLRAEVLAEAGAAQDTELVARLRTAGRAERPRMLVQVLEQQLVETLHAFGIERPAVIDPDAGFGDLGLMSVAAVWFVQQVGKLIDRTLPDTATFRYPSLSALAEHLLVELFGVEADRGGAPPADARGAALAVTEGSGPASAVAVIGIACRVAGAPTLDALWELLVRGTDTVSGYPADREPDLGARTREGLRGSYLEGAGRFDAQFFGFKAEDARGVDPQQRLAMELTWDALEDAGCDPWSSKDGTTSMFLGLQGNGYPGSTFDVSPSMAAARVAQFFDLRGPVVTVDTACSSSLVALHQAVHSLRRGEADRAIVGAVNIIGATDNFHDLRALGVLSDDGRCKSFDASADGFGQGEGGVVLVLERVELAIARGRRIHALVRGTAINHDGRTSRLTAPNPIAQEEVIGRALQAAGVTREAVQYVEAHATGTTLGDPTELEALHHVFAGRAGPPVAIGSIKSNIGHLSAASGLAGLAKVILAMRYRRIPASRHVRQPTTRVDWRTLALEIQAEAGSWPSPQAPLIAGVSSYAFSGTNAHVVVEEPPPVRGEARSAADGPWVLVLSAKTSAALRARVERFIAHLESEIGTFRDVAYTASCHRAHLEARVAVVARTHRGAARELRDWLRGVTAGAAGDGAAELEQLAEQYRAGSDIDWDARFGQRGRVVDLPGYPWQGEHYWARKPAAGEARVAPLVHRHLELLDAAGRHVFETELDVTDPSLAYLADHRRGGVASFPNAGLISMAWTGAQHVHGARAWGLCDVRFGASVELGARTRLQLVANAESAERARFAIYSRGANGTLTHAEGTVCHSDRPPPVRACGTAAELRRRCTRIASPQVLYQRLLELGIEHGPAFQALSEVRVGDGEMIGTLRIPARVVAQLAGDGLHPSVLEACLSLVQAARVDDGGTPWVAESMRALSVYASLADASSVIVRRHGAGPDGALGAVDVDLWILDAGDGVLAQGLGVRFTAASIAASIPASRAAAPVRRIELSIEMRVRGAAASERARLLGEYLTTLVATVAGLGADEVDRTTSLASLGIESLLSMRIANRLQSELAVTLSMKDVLQSDTIDELARLVAGALDGPAVKRQGWPERGTHPVLSSAQQRLWFMHHYAPGGAFDHVAFARKLTGELNAEAVRLAVEKIVARHEALRTVFPARRGVPYQHVMAAPRWALPVEDLRGEDAGRRVEKLDEIARVTELAPFDLEIDLPIRARLVRTGDREHVLFVTIHHLVSDAISVAIFWRELAALYNAGLTGAPLALALAPIPMQLADFAAWERRLVGGEDVARQLAYWKEQLAEVPAQVTLPLRGPRPAQQTFKGRTVSLVLEPAVVERARALAAEHGTTPFIVMLAAYRVVIGRHAAQDDFCIGYPLANRAHADVERLIGLFNSMLPIRTPMRGDTSFRDLVLAEKQHTLDAYANKDAPFEAIVEATAIPRDPSRNPLFQVTFVSQNTSVDEGALVGLEAEEVPKSFEGGATFDLTTWVWGQDQMHLRFIYNPDLFAHEMIERLARDYERLLTDATTKPDERLASLRERIANPWLTITVSATFTVEPLEESLVYWAERLGLRPRLTIAPYNQVFQQLLDPSSELAATEGVGILLVRVEDWVRDVEAEARIEDAIPQLADQLVEAVREGRARAKAPTLVCVCPLQEDAAPRLSALHQAAIDRLRALDSMAGVYVLTAEEAVRRYGVTRIYDAEADHLGHIPFTPRFFAALGAWLASKVLALVGPPYKVLVFDCDNTLWKGVLGEDGVDGIGVEEPYLSVQRFARAQRERGMLLATCSRNEHADVAQAFQVRRDMPLEWTDFVAHRINWQRKADNLLSLAEELDVGLDSFIFVDDDDATCADVRQSCPDVLVLQLPREPERIARFLDHAWGIGRLKVTDTDRERTEMYHQQRERAEAKRRAPSLDRFLEELELEVEIAAMTDDQLDRVAQLLSRTNQLNMTTRRLSASAVQAERERGTEWWTVDVRDRFGSYGLTGVVSVRAKAGVLDVPDFLLSCRVLGKKVEHTIVEWLAARAGALRCDRIVFEYAPTAKNSPARQLLETLPGDRSAQQTGFRLTVPVAAAAEARKIGSAGTEVADEADAAAPVATKRATAPGILADIAAQVQTVDEVVRAVEGGRRTRARARGAGAYVPPRTAAEQLLALLWTDVLGVEAVGIHDDFFALGGTSLMSVQLAALAHERGVKLTPRQLQEHTTIASLATIVEVIDGGATATGAGASRERFGNANKAFAAVLDEVLAEGRTRTSARATVGQEYFYRLERAAPDPLAYATRHCLVIEGDLDVAALTRSVEATIAGHAIFRTGLEERDGVLYQVVAEQAGFELEVTTIGELAPDAWGEHIDRAYAELVPDLELAPGRQIRARLLGFGAARVLFLVVHHGIMDGAGHTLLLQEIFARYAGQPGGDAAELIDYSEALTRFRATTTGQAYRDRWLDYLRGAAPVEMPVDRDRRTVDAQRDRLPAGVTPDRMHFPYFQLELPAESRAGADALADATRASGYIVYLSALAWLLHRRSGQRDICIQITYDPRGDVAKLAGLIGPGTTWKVVRIDLEGCGSLREVISSATRSVLTMNELGVLPEFFDAVPHPLRRMVFNYIPITGPSPLAAPGLELRPFFGPFPVWKRPWDLHLTMIDRPSGSSVFWTGNDALFERETVEALLQEYFAILAGRSA